MSEVCPVLATRQNRSEVQRAARDGLSELLRQSMARFGASGESLVLDGAPVAAIVRAVENFHAELLVVGAHGRTGIALIALGSVAEQLCGFRLARSSQSALAKRKFPARASRDTAL